MTTSTWSTIQQQTYSKNITAINTISSEDEFKGKLYAVKNDKIAIFSNNFFSKLCAWLSGYSFKKDKVTNFLNNFENSQKNLYESHLEDEKNILDNIKAILTKLRSKSELYNRSTNFDHLSVLPPPTQTAPQQNLKDRYNNIANDKNLQLEAIKLLQEAAKEQPLSIFNEAIEFANTEEKALLNAYKDKIIKEKSKQRNNFLRFLETGLITIDGKNKEGITPSGNLFDLVNAEKTRTSGFPGCLLA